MINDMHKRDIQPPVKPLSKEELERMMERIEKMTPEEVEEQKARLRKRFSGFAKLYKDRPMA